MAKACNEDIMKPTASYLPMCMAETPGKSCSVQLFTPDDEPAIDPESIALLRGLEDDDGEDLLQRVIQMFFQDGPEALAGLHVALDVGDARALARIAHTVKGSGGYFGAHNFSDLCDAVEVAAKAGNLDPISDLLALTGLELQRVLAALRSEISHTAQ